MNSYTAYILVAISVLTSIITIVPTFASTVDREPCPRCGENFNMQDAQLARLSALPIRVWADQKSYNYGSDVHIHGIVASLKEGVPVTLTVTGPQGNVVRIAQVEVSQDKTFDAMLSTSGNLWSKEGTYTIRVQYGQQAVNDKVTIELVGTSQVKGSVCKVDELAVMSTTDVYCIPFNAVGIKITKATVSRTTFSIDLTVNAQNDGSVTLTIPRSVLDSTARDGDTPFLVLVDGEEVDSFEVASSSTARTLEITVPSGTTQVEVIGTFAVPEFGTMAAIILAVAIVSIIAVSARSRLGALPKY
jgi:predicted secreted protein with PEFG-CTERM motif